MQAGTATPVKSISPAAYTATVNGTGVDLANYGSAQIALIPGTITDGTHTPKIQHSPDNSTWTDCVPGTDQTGSGFTALATGVVQTASYIGGDRYIRVVSTVAGATTGGVYSALALLGIKRKLP